MKIIRFGISFLLLFISLHVFAWFPNTDPTRHNLRNEEIYNAFLRDDKGVWKDEIMRLSSQKGSECGEIRQLMNLYYGYIGWCIRDGNKNEGIIALEKMKDLQERDGSRCLAENEAKLYHAARLAFSILLGKEKGMIAGPRCMRLVKEVREKEPNNYFAFILQGNIHLNMPGIFGGSKKKAIENFRKAEALMVKQQRLLNDWEYIHLLCVTGLTYQNLGNEKAAKEYGNRILKEAPGMIWAQETFGSSN